jgi:hypothetical protein
MNQRFFIGGSALFHRWSTKTAKEALLHPLSKRFFAARNMVDIPT